MDSRETDNDNNIEKRDLGRPAPSNPYSASSARPWQSTSAHDKPAQDAPEHQAPAHQKPAQDAPEHQAPEHREPAHGEPVEPDDGQFHEVKETVMRQARAAAIRASAPPVTYGASVSGDAQHDRARDAYQPSNYVGARSKRSRRTKTRVALIAVAVVVVLLVVPLVALAVSAQEAKTDAQTLMTQFSTFADQMTAGDLQGAKATVQECADTAKKLDDNVGSFLWAPATLIPVYGEDVKQVRTIANVADELTEAVLIPVVDALPPEGASAFLTSEGFNAQLVRDVVAPFENSADVIKACAEEVDSLGEAHISQLQSATPLVKRLTSLLAQVADIAPALPGILGMNGPRTYLLVAMTEAEPRSVGGFPGSAGLVTMVDGHFEIGEMGAPDLPITDEESMFQATEEEQLIFGNRVAQYFYDAGYIPHFPRAAEFMKQMWEIHGRPGIEGIIALDPVFLQRVLGMIGGVTTSSGIVVDGSNAAEILMHGAYMSFETDEGWDSDSTGASMTASQKQDAFFGEVAHQALERFFDNIASMDIVQFANLLLTSIDDKRLFVWMANPEEEAAIEKLNAAGAVSNSEEDPELGVYVGAAMGAKFGWYLDVRTVVGDGTRNVDGSTSYPVTTTITNLLSEEEAQTLPVVVTGNGYVSIKRSVSEVLLDVYLYAPAGGSISNIQTNGYFVPSTEFGGGWYTRPTDEPMTQATYNGREVYYGVTGVHGLESTTITYTVTTSRLATEALSVDTTPLARE